MAGNEAVEYAAKAEETVNEGLRILRPNERDGLWIVSSQIQTFLGDQPAVIAALEQAVGDNPATIIGRYLLGLAYLRLQRADDALAVLRPVIDHHPEEFRSAVAYARAMECLGEPYPRSIAILKLSASDGLKDPRFIAALGGMLSMAGELTEAAHVFGQARHAGFGSRELGRIEYVPDPKGQGPPRLEGRIISLGATYGFVQVPGYPDFFLAGRRMGARRLAVGTRVYFTPGFSARGGWAENVQYPEPS